MKYSIRSGAQEQASPLAYEYVGLAAGGDGILVLPDSPLEVKLTLGSGSGAGAPKKGFWSMCWFSWQKQKTGSGANAGSQQESEWASKLEWAVARVVAARRPYITQINIIIRRTLS